MDQYAVVFEPYTERHFIKSFRRKYSEKQWGSTQDVIVFMCERIDEIKLTNKLDLIKEKENLAIYKLDFAVVGTKESPKSSGNRCILLADSENKNIRVLLVYHKTDIAGDRETDWWWREIFSAYADIKALFK